MKKNTSGDSGKTNPIKANFKIREAQSGKSHGLPAGALPLKTMLRDAAGLLSPAWAQGKPPLWGRLAGPGADLSFSDRFDRLSEMRPCSGIGKYDQY